MKGVELARTAGVKAIGIIHLHPAHSDTALRDMEADMQAEMPTAFIARECQSLTVGAPRAVGSRPNGRPAVAREMRRRIKVA